MTQKELAEITGVFHLLSSYTIIKIAIVVGILGYVVCPVDLMPGFFLDDMVVAALGVAGLMASKKMFPISKATPLAN